MLAVGAAELPKNGGGGAEAIDWEADTQLMGQMVLTLKCGKVVREKVQVVSVMNKSKVIRWRREERRGEGRRGEGNGGGERRREKGRRKRRRERGREERRGEGRRGEGKGGGGKSGEEGTGRGRGEKKEGGERDTDITLVR